MDWVTGRAKRDKIIIQNRQRLWDDLCSAIQQAVQSFNHYYKRDGEVSFSLPYPDQAWVRSRGLSEHTAHFVLTTERSIVVEIAKSGYRVSKFTLAFTVDDKQEAALATDGKIVSHEQISQIALEPILFGEPAELYQLILENSKF